MTRGLLLFLFIITCNEIYSQNLPSEMHFSSDGRMLLLGDLPNSGLYDQSLVRSIHLNFSQPNYWSMLTNNKSSGTDLGASMIVDGITYDSVGVRFKGQTSYSQTTNSQKKSFNISLDYLYPNQEIMGYKTLNLNNSFQDPSFIREIFFLNQIKKHIPAAKAAYVKLYINGANWGLYPSVQQLNKQFLKEWFFTNDGTNWRADRPPGSVGPPGAWGDGTAALNFLGNDTNTYKNFYYLKSTEKSSPWTDLISVCDALNNTSLSNLSNVLPGYLDIDRTLWFLASENLFSDDDSYIHKGKMDYYVYWETETGRTTPIEYDGNSVMKTNVQTWSPFYNEGNVSYPLMNKLFAIPEYRQRYLAHMRTLINEIFEPTATSVIIDNYKSQIDTIVQNDPKKLYSYAAFNNEIQILKNFITARRNYLLTHPEINQTGPAISSTEYIFNNISWNQPIAGQSVTVRTNITSANGISNVHLYYSDLLTGNFIKMQMYDDGAHDDLAPGDGIYGSTIPGNAAGTYVRFYIEAVSANTDLTVTYDPPGAEHIVYVYLVAPVSSSSSDVVINEIMASNATSVTDDFGEYDDWIELYNNSNNPVDLTGYYVTDNPANVNKWDFPSGTILQPNSYLIVWADEDSSQGPFHANFKLSALGEQLWLINSMDEIADSLSWGAQTSDMAYARIPNGSGNFLTQQHTFNGNNELTNIVAADQAAHGFLLFPNPAKDALNIKIYGKTESNIEIYNSMGALIYSQLIKNETIINTTGWRDGMYLVKTGNLTRKLVITH